MYKVNSKKEMTEEPPSPQHADNSSQDGHDMDYLMSQQFVKPEKVDKQSFLSMLFQRQKSDNSLRKAIEDVIENESDDEDSADYVLEKTLIANILEMRDLTAVDIMIPRADIVALDVDSTPEELHDIIVKAQHTRYPVYRDDLDNIIGAIHIKDVLLSLMKIKSFDTEKLCRSIPIVSPAMPAFDLLIQMQETKKHMVLVVDEYGGIDGMVTIGDIIEDIVGNIDDEYNPHTEQRAIVSPDGSVIADAKYSVEDFEDKFGIFLLDEEREELNTLAGVVFTIAGYVPVRGEILTHEPSGVEFEVLDADARRINRLKIRNLPAKTQ